MGKYLSLLKGCMAAMKDRPARYITPLRSKAAFKESFGCAYVSRLSYASSGACQASRSPTFKLGAQGSLSQTVVHI